MIIIHGATDNPRLMQKINFHRYRERMHLTVEQAAQEPNEEIQRSLIIWSNDRKRDKLKAARSSSK
jgi:hypothetical protein